MSFWRSPPGAIVIVAAAAVLVCLGIVVGQVHGLTHPERSEAPPIDFDALLMQVDEVELRSTDDVRLGGWLIRGDPDQPAIVLCHDLGSDRTSLTHLAVALRSHGFTLLLFDFRGHGDSAGSRSTLGLTEKRDILGAVNFLETVEGVLTDKVGIYGVGMGAYAAVLAAADRPSLRVLVLDGLYPDVTYELATQVFDGWSFGQDHLGFIPAVVFSTLNKGQLSALPASDVLGNLFGRDTLLLASETNQELGAQMRQMYDRLPEQIDFDGNLVVLPSTQREGLYGDQLGQYHERVGRFFGTRLMKRPAPPVPVS